MAPLYLRKCALTVGQSADQRQENENINVNSNDVSYQITATKVVQ